MWLLLVSSEWAAYVKWPERKKREGYGGGGGLTEQEKGELEKFHLADEKYQLEKNSQCMRPVTAGVLNLHLL